MFKLFNLSSSIFAIFNQILKSLQVCCPFKAAFNGAALGRRQVESVCRPCCGRDCESLESQTEEKQPKVNLSKVELLAISCCSSWLFLTFTCSLCLRFRFRFRLRGCHSTHSYKYLFMHFYFKKHYKKLHSIAK